MDLVDLGALRRHRLAIQADSDGPFVWGVADQVWLALHTEVQPNMRNTISEAYQHWSAATNRITDMRTIASKLDWMLGVLRNGDLDRFAWMYYAASDIVAYLTSARSLLDHVARALVSVAPNPDGLPKFSFNDLRLWLIRHPERAAWLGEAGARAVVTCSWLDTLKDLRDRLIHQDARATVFPTTDGIQFQIHDRARSLVIERPLLLGNGVASFEFVSASVAARVHDVLENIGNAVGSQLSLQLLPTDGWNRHQGLAVIAKWTDDLIVSLGGQGPPPDAVQRSSESQPER